MEKYGYIPKGHSTIVGYNACVDAGDLDRLTVVGAFTKVNPKDENASVIGFNATSHGPHSSTVGDFYVNNDEIHFTDNFSIKRMKCSCCCNETQCMNWDQKHSLCFDCIFSTALYHRGLMSFEKMKKH